MDKPIYNILLAINQPLTEAGIRTLLSGYEAFQIHQLVDVNENVVEHIVDLNPDLLVTDYNVPEFINFEDIERIQDRLSLLSILIISADVNKTSILKAVQLGIKGYLTNECSKEELLLAVNMIAKGEKFFCGRILNIILEKHLPEKGGYGALLTTREKEILQAIAEGKSTQAIADNLHLSPHTIQTHRKSIIRKLKIKSPTQFVIHALDMGLITQK